MNIIYGICGVGNGHTYRQEPVVEKLLTQGHKICLFAYANSLNFYQQKYATHPQIRVIEVERSFIPENMQVQLSLSFSPESLFVCEQETDLTTNQRAILVAQQWLGMPDLCISDYEPISAQYAYFYHTKVITFDQQSKYLCDEDNFPGAIDGITYLDEVIRLNQFFPKVHKRIACSFFNLRVPRKDLLLIAPHINKAIINQPHHEAHYLVYLSSQPGFEQNLSQIIETLHARAQETYHIFLPTFMLFELETFIKKNHLIVKHSHDEQILLRHRNLVFYSHTSTAFTKILSYCHGVISTAGHTLLSECMTMNIPVYALPINVYEQQLNAWTIENHHFGLMDKTINTERLYDFIEYNTHFRTNIIKDKTLEHGILLCDTKNVRSLDRIIFEIENL